MSREIEWPKDLQMPCSIKEILASGWSMDWSESRFSKDERLHTGTAIFRKRAGNVMLELQIPFEARLTFGKPTKFTAFSWGQRRTPFVGRR